MRFSGHNTRRLYNEIVATPRFQWKNLRKEPPISKSITNFLNTNLLDRDTISRLSDSVTTSLKIGVPAAYALGLYVISVYLINSGAPLVISDFSTTLWFVSLAALIAVFAFLLTAAFFYPPAFIFPPSPKLVKYTNIKPFNSTLTLKEFIIQWLMINGVPFATLFAATLSSITNVSMTLLGTLVTLVGILGSIVLVIFLIRQYSALYRRCSFRPRLALCARVLISSVWKAFWAAWWAAVLFIMMSKFVTLLAPATLWLIAFIIYLYVTYFLSSRVIGGIRYRVLWPTMFFAFILIMFNPNYSGRKALQVLRIGGGIPVEILHKTMIPGGKDVVAQTIKGCMIINGGSHIIITVQNNPTLAICQAGPSSNQVHVGEMLKGMEIIAGSDVINITAL
jgi:hypothetical protein